MSDTSQTEREEQYVTAGKAATLLGTTRMKIAELLKKGVLPYKENPLDARKKMIPLSAIEKLRAWSMTSVA